MQGTGSAASESDASTSAGATEGDPRGRIVRATHCAPCGHGYASLTMQDIADESDPSKAALHYHYDSKVDLLRAFLDYLLDELLREDGPAATGRNAEGER